ncbi:hypothetical protein [Povalibacter sp.]
MLTSADKAVNLANVTGATGCATEMVMVSALTPLWH